LILLSPLERLLVTEREPRRKASSGFALPIMGERQLGPEAFPVLVTNSKGVLIEPKPSESGILRYGMFPSDLSEDFSFFSRTVANLIGFSLSAPTVHEGLAKIKVAGFEPHYLVSDYATISSATNCSRDTIDQVTSTKGYFTNLGDIKVVAADLPEEVSAVITAHPSLCGYYTRVDSHLGLTLTRLTTAWCVLPS
jgi:hypothetical protein